MAKIIRRGRGRFWVDQDGIEVPEKYVPEDDQKRDKLVTEVFDKILKLQKEMADLKDEITEKVNKHLNEVAESYGENWKGNAKLSDFSKNKELEVKISKVLTFDEKLQIAKAKIDSCIKNWSKGSGNKIKVLVNKAFKVDNKGDVDAKTILGLQSLNFDEPEWNEAMEIINKSVQVKNTKTYYNFRMKKEDGSYKTIPLNFSKL